MCSLLSVFATLECLPYLLCQEGVVIIHDFIEKKQQTAFISPVDSTLRRLVHLQPSAAHRTQPTNLRIVESTESHQPPENIHHR